MKINHIQKINDIDENEMTNENETDKILNKNNNNSKNENKGKKFINNLNKCNKILILIIVFLILCIIILLHLYSNMKNKFNKEIYENENLIKEIINTNNPLIYSKPFEKCILNIIENKKYILIDTINEFIFKLNNSNYDSLYNNTNYNSAPEISIIIPIYNGVKYIQKLLKSFRLQNFKNYELILVDDKSTDNSYNILLEEAKKDKRLKIYQNNINSGTLTTRYNGFIHSTGRFITFLDQDDFYAMENSLLIMYNSMLIKNVDVVEYCTYIFNYNNELHIYGKKDPNNNIIKYNINNTKYNLEDKRFSHMVWQKLYKREILDKAYKILGNKVNIKAMFGEDTLLMAVVFQIAKSYYPLNIPLHLNYEHDDSASRFVHDYRNHDIISDKIQNELIRMGNMIYHVYDVYDENANNKPFYEDYLKSFHFRRIIHLFKNYPKIKETFVTLCQKLLHKNNLFKLKKECNKIIKYQ